MADEVRGEAGEALVKIEECLSHHRQFCDKVDRRYRAYRGVMEAPQRAEKSWRKTITPPYINHIVETTLASLLDDELRFRVRPKAKFYEPGEAERAKKGAKALEMLLRWQLGNCRFDEAQRPYGLQNMIAGLTVGKVCWHQTTRIRRQLVTEQRVIEGPFGPVGTVPVLVETDRPETVFDGPTFEVVDVRDFIWDEAAVSLDRCPIVGHRVWMTFDELKQLEKRGKYKNVDRLKESRDFSGDEWSNRENEHSGAKRTKDRIEVLEIYRRTADGIRVCAIANRAVVLEEPRKHPYWHGEMPFVVCSTQPDLFRIVGMSQVEKIEALQKMLWDVMNTRLENLEFVNQAIAIVQEGFDHDAWVHEPGAVNETPDPASVQMWSPNVIPAEVSLGAEALLKGDMQQLAAAFPFASGSESQTVDNKTATGASIVTSIAQRSMQAMKNQLWMSYARVGQQFLELDQQYIREPTYIEILDVDSQREFEEILPEVLQGQFKFDMRPMTESMMRSEKRAEALAKFQTLMQAVAPLAMMGAPLNPRTLVEDFLEAYDDQDMDRFFSAAPQAALQAGGGQNAGAVEGQTNGVTAQQAIDPAVSPSNQTSMSGERAMQRALAMTGQGGPNAG